MFTPALFILSVHDFRCSEVLLTGAARTPDDLPFVRGMDPSREVNLKNTEF